MTKGKRRRSFKSGDMRVFPGSGGAPRQTPAYAGQVGQAGHAPDASDLPQKMRKLLRAVVAFNAKKG
jgi:hypothetical protein